MLSGFSCLCVEEDGTPVVRSATCVEKKGYMMHGSSSCSFCLQLAQRLKFVEKVTWWAQKIELTNVATSFIAGDSCNQHRTYAEVYKEIQQSVAAIPAHLLNRAAKTFMESRVRWLPRTLPPKEICF